MMEHVKGPLMQKRRCRAANLLRLFARLVVCSMVCLHLSGCAGQFPLSLFSSAPTDDTADPALSDDPAVAAQFEASQQMPAWEWSDGEQRWLYMADPLPKPRVAADAWLFDPAAIRLRVIAPPQLNLYLDRPHSLILRVIQLGDRKAFDDRRTTTFGLQEMLSINAFDPAAVLGVSEFSLLPGTDQMISVDRLENARYIGIVAGYYGLDGRRVARLIPVPGIDMTDSKTRWLRTLSFGFLGGTETVPARPAKLKMLLQLGIDKIDLLKTHAQ